VWFRASPLSARVALLASRSGSRPAIDHLQLPVNELKLDRSFLRALRCDEDVDPVDVQLVASLVSLAHLLNLTVIAEGVETQAQVERLRSTGCDAGQGTYFGAAADPAEMSRLVGPDQS
jgi:EAL domain-containing protein (putative c-di-GMP-specific phosphodiesterase class I)